jgi:aspartyl/asparaginyl-tRNA synthetase
MMQESKECRTNQCWERIEPRDFDFVMTKFREFFKKKGMVEVATQSVPDILSACEDTQNLATFTYVDGEKYPLKQTGQMILEDELLRDPSLPGCYCYTTSYRFEKQPKPGRHDLIFPMMEFEIHGDLTKLIQFEREMLEDFGFGPASSFPEGNYQDICQLYKVKELTHEHEERLLRDFGPIFFLKNFPEETSPFWNMKRTADGLAKKCDVILNGIETIGSAERSCDVAEMKKRFYTITDGTYASTLFDTFKKHRVEKELNTFFSHKFIERSGAGIGVTRMIKACKAAKLI